MPDLAHWSVFLTATIVLLLIPGPSVLFVVARGIDRGFRAALFSAIGLAIGDLFQVICAAIGLSTLLASSVTAFAIVKYAGAAYLIFLGVRRWREKDSPSLIDAAGEPRSLNDRMHALVLQGFSVNALNPKTALFFLALLPQFVVHDRAPAWIQILALGGAFVLLGFVTNSIYGRLGDKVSSLVRVNARFQNTTRYVAGGTLIALGIAAALSPAPKRH